MFQVVPPKKMTLLQGIPGSGKSTLARALLAHELANSVTDCTGVILSTDEYWTVEHQIAGQPSGLTTYYKYDPAKVGMAHNWNQRRAVDECQNGTNFIFIDNTNIEKWQAAPYLAVAKMYDYSVQAITVSCGLDEAIRRNARREYDRRIPEDVLRRMHEKIEPLL